MSKILIIRLSSFGDVAMLVPVVYSVAKAYPNDQFVVLTRKIYAPLFDSLASNIQLITFSKHRHKGISGILSLRKKIYSMDFTHIVDEHDVIRTKVIRFPLFRPSGIQSAHIDKGRDEKARIVKSKDTRTQLTPTVERYQATFQKLGFNFKITFQNLFQETNNGLDYSSLTNWKPTENGGLRIGIAPFSRYEVKNYPLNKMEEVIKSLNEIPNCQIFLFGAKGNEEYYFRLLVNKYPKAVCVAGQLHLKQELLLMHSLDVFVSMDSSNMHLASLAGTPVISIWGPTHPSLGFYGFGQKPENAVQVCLDCRPCSVYGNKPCIRKDHACMQRIEPETIVNKIHEFIPK